MNVHLRKAQLGPLEEDRTPLVISSVAPEHLKLSLISVTLLDRIIALEVASQTSESVRIVHSLIHNFT